MTWEVCTCEAWGERSYNCHSVLFHPDGKTIYAAIEPDGTLNGIWRSPDRGKSLGAADERASPRRILPADQPRPRAIRSRRHLRARFQPIGPRARYLPQHQRRQVVERDPGRPVPERAADGLQQHDCRPSPPSRQRDLGRHEAAPHRQRRPQLAHHHEEGPRRQKLRARRPSRAALARRRPDPLRQRRRRLGQPRRRSQLAGTQPPDGDDDVLRSRCRAVQREDLRRRDAGQRHA